MYKVIFYVKFSWHSAFLSGSVSCLEISAVPMVLKTPDFESYTSDQLASCEEYYGLKCRHSKFKICLWWHQRVDALIGRHHLQVPAVIENEGI